MKKKNPKLILLAFLIVFSLLILAFFIKRYFIDNSNEGAAVKLYTELIDLTIAENLSLTKESQYISIDKSSLIDPLNKEKLNQNSINEIVEYCKKYNENVYFKNHDELIADGLGDKNGLDGYLIKFDIHYKIKINSAYISASIYKANLGTASHKYIIKYVNSLWKITSTGERIVS